MPYDPTTFENLCPYPNRWDFEEKITAEIQAGIRIIPSEHLIDSKVWIKNQVDEYFRAERKKYQESENESISLDKKKKCVWGNLQDIYFILAPRQSPYEFPFYIAAELGVSIPAITASRTSFP